MHWFDRCLLYATMGLAAATTWSCVHMELRAPGAASSGDLSVCLQFEILFARGLLADAAWQRSASLVRINMTSHGMYQDAKELRSCICIGIGIGISNHDRIEQKPQSRRQYHNSLGFVAQGLGSRHVLRLGDAGPGATQELPNHVQGQSHQASPTEHHEQQPPYSHTHTPVPCQLWNQLSRAKVHDFCVG